MMLISRTLIASALIAALAACSSSSDNPPVTQNDQVPDDQAPNDQNTGIANPYVPSADGLPEPVIPQLDPTAAPVPGPSPTDPFNSLLEIDPEAAVPGGGPTTPKNLRIDLVSNDWAEFSWAPSKDDGGEVVEYRVSRSDGVVYTIREDQTDPASGTQLEIDKYWATTSFIDCNYTRFAERLHACSQNGPKPGDIFSYQVSAVDDDGNESALSNSISIHYHEETGAAVPLYEDFYISSDRFVQDHDLTNTAYFLDEFRLVFEDDFDGDAIDDTKWNTELTWGDTRIINGEQQHFVSTQRETDFGYNPFNFEDGILTIEAIQTPEELVGNLPEVCNEEDPFGVERCAFLSGALSGHDKFGFTYGFVEGRMKASGTSGALSSFYMYHRYAGTDQNRHAPEIDIVEYLGENPFGDEDAFQTYHFDDPNTDIIDDPTKGITRSSPTMFYKNPEGELYSDEYHTWAVLWEPQLVIWYIDGREVKRLSGVQVSRQQMNIVTYLVAGSGWAPTPTTGFPLQFEIDYIRAYQRPEYTTNSVGPGKIGAVPETP